MFQNLASTYMTSSSSHVSGGFLLVILLLGLVFGIIEVAGMWKMFIKAGRPGWAAIIPFYNFWVLFEVAGKPGWWSLSVLVSIIPFVGWIVPAVLELIAFLELAKRFGKSP